MINRLYDVITCGLDDNEYMYNEPMKYHTSFKIGGPADVFIIPNTKEKLVDIIRKAKENQFKYYIIGNGSNLLVSDDGIRGIVIQISRNLNDFSIDDNVVSAEAGILLSTLAKRIYENSLEGFEFASGIPGTLGGAICMNAGAYGGEMKDVVAEVEVIDEEGNMIVIEAERLELGYRESILQTKGLIAVSAKLRFNEGNQKHIKAIMDDLSLKRRTKQPIDKPSAGSTFKRPEGYYAGKLIMDSGLMGKKIGGAKVSDKHAGFIINDGNATCRDVLDLMKYVQDTVFDRYKVKLEPEVKRLGIFE